MAHVVHLISHPHFYCPIHGHFESYEGHDQPNQEQPADRGEHQDEDTACLLVIAASGGEEAFQAQPLATEQLCAPLVPAVAAAESSLTDAILYAPKHSPPLTSRNS